MQQVYACCILLRKVKKGYNVIFVLAISTQKVKDMSSFFPLFPD
jgi:hypothetical protein